ncbi:hypothetical protein OV208_16375 [Corallococcus sp. bb12-1]|uniref:hypothetical protein n=1 Tax=Corallococcus sp. bb12-1 TaxID=2996784 RepID=UPI00226FD1A4|nr:hypothetical protein [Corallococcus sp. bb12-1]MCY1042897.1 hypothetical protein [Corallococcus sp. bb12-1]
MSSDPSKRPWNRIRESLGTYAPEPLAVRLRDILAPLRSMRSGGGAFSRGVLTPFKHQVQDLLGATLGPWYTESGLPLGNENLGGYCWCHAFFNSVPTPNLDVDDNVRAMLEALERTRKYLYALDALFEAARARFLAARGDKGLQATVLAEALVQTVDFTAAETYCEEAWYQVAESAMDWCFDALDVSVGESTQALMGTLFVFESWSPPPPEAFRASAQRVSVAALNDEVTP